MSHVESGGQKGSQDFELNLAPIIDCLVVLIAFLMVSLSYLSIQMLDAGITSPGGLSQVDTSVLSIEVKIETANLLDVSVMQGGKKLSNQKVERAAWATELKGIVAKMDRKPATALISAQDDISYDVVVQTLDELKSFVPQVQLSGF
ncbi:MAG: biopolymer transporter ExbD [Bdellovibrionota bacterium]